MTRTESARRQAGSRTYRSRRRSVGRWFIKLDIRFSDFHQGGPNYTFLFRQVNLAPMPTDPFNLQRFVNAQDDVFEEVRLELKNGRKTSHWMWFIFPQIAGLGSSSTARYYAISSKEEAAEYLEHPILGSRLRECTQLVVDLNEPSIRSIFGSPDDLKFCSSMTLFAHATPDNQLFVSAINKYCGGKFDELTLRRF